MDADQLIAVLFAPPKDYSAAASRLSRGRLWHAFMPGTSPELALPLLGGDAAGTMAQALVFTGYDWALEQAGFPVPWGATAMELAEVILNDGRALIPREAQPAGATVVQIELPNRITFHAQALGCLDHAFSSAVSGDYHLPIEQALVMSPEHDLAPLVGIADASSRYRFIAAFLHAEEDIDRFRAGYFRRSVVEGMLQAMHRTLSSIVGGTYGWDEDGWPVWWQGTGDDADAVLAGVPTAVRQSAKSISVTGHTVGRPS
jgi:hypothetical protein